MDLIIGAAIAVISSVITILISHWITTSYNKNNEIQTLQSKVESYIRFLGNRSTLYFTILLRWTYSTTLQSIVLKVSLPAEELKQRSYVHEDKTIEKGDIITAETQSFVESVCLLCRLKKAKENDRIKMIWSAPFNIANEMKLIQEAKDFYEIGTAFHNALAALPELKEKYEEALEFIIKDLLE